MIDELIERAEKGEGSDRELDCDIGCAVDDWTAHPTFGMAGDNYVLYRHKGLASQMPPFTTSLDAVIALIEEKLPGRTIETLREAINATSRRFHLHICFETPEAAKFLPRAALAAALRALKEIRHVG